LTLIDTEVVGNDCADGPAIRSNDGTLTVLNSTVDAYNYWTIRSSGTARVVNSTIDGGRIGEPIWHAGGGTFTLIGSTVKDVGYNGVLGGGPFFVSNSVVILSPYWLTCGAAVITSGGGNIESPGDTCGFDQPTDLVNVTAEQLKLGPLADNGGPTMTHALLPGSVAIDRIAPAMCVDADGEPLTTDQRGVARPQGTMCDVGAFEWADCSGTACDDGSECTADYCDASDDSWCRNILFPAGTPCGGGSYICDGAGTCGSYEVLGDKDGFGQGLSEGDTTPVSAPYFNFDLRSASDPFFTDVRPLAVPFTYTHVFVPPLSTHTHRELRMLTLGIQDGDNQVVGRDMDVRLFLDNVEVPGAFDSVDQFEFIGGVWSAIVGYVTIEIPSSHDSLLADGQVEIRLEVEDSGTPQSGVGFAIDYSEIAFY
jgi:hypothetical protein